MNVPQLGKRPPWRQQQILDYIEERGEASRSELAAHFRLSPKTIDRFRLILRSKGFLEPAKRGHTSRCSLRGSSRGNTGVLNFDIQKYWR